MFFDTLSYSFQSSFRTLPLFERYSVSRRFLSLIRIVCSRKRKQLFPSLPVVFVVLVFVHWNCSPSHSHCVRLSTCIKVTIKNVENERQRKTTRLIRKNRRYILCHVSRFLLLALSSSRTSCSLRLILP